MTAADMVTAALQELGVYGGGENVSGEDLRIGLRSLNWQLKSWTSRGINAWREVQGAAVLDFLSPTVALDPRCLDVLDARFARSPLAPILYDGDTGDVLLDGESVLVDGADATSFERPLQRWEVGQYQQIPNKDTVGTPTVYVITRTSTAVSMTVWPVPNRPTTIGYTYSRIPDDVTEGSQMVDLPQEWTEACYLALAVRLASTFGVTRSDPATVQMIGQRAADLERRLLDQDRPASLYIGSALYDYF
jgi:hypothetical protein